MLVDVENRPADRAARTPPRGQDRTAMMRSAVADDIRAELAVVAEEVSSAIGQWLASEPGAPPRLIEAMRYSLEAGGKRLRPALVLWSCEAVGGPRPGAMPAAIAVECVHTFSLIHDDLPALDDDDLRRGRPASHRQFGEALAILAGDALLAAAFEIIASSPLPPRTSIAISRELARASGWTGLIGGELVDLDGETCPPDVRLVERIHSAKTAALIRASCRMGGLIGEADERQLAALSDYGQALGMAFQAADDLLDVIGSAAAMGKNIGKDASAGKQTFVRAVGTAESRAMVRQQAERAAAAIQPLGTAGERLERLAWYVVERDS